MPSAAWEVAADAVDVVVVVADAVDAVVVADAADVVVADAVRVVAVAASSRDRESLGLLADRTLTKTLP